MSELKTYICDVKDCRRNLGSLSGSNVRLEIRSPGPAWRAPGVSSPDLCDEHLAEFLKWLEDRGIKLDVDV